MFGMSTNLGLEFLGSYGGVSGNFLQGISRVSSLAGAKARELTLVQ